jgi:hypothetical protein
MRAALLGFAALAALAVPAIPAQAQDMAAQNASSRDGSLRGIPAPRVHRGFALDTRDCLRRDRRDRKDGDRRDRRDRRRFCDVFLGDTYVDGQWALYNNRSWESDSYNDWWHDQPWRSFPRWVSSNQECKRMWWSGGGWRC